MRIENLTIPTVGVSAAIRFPEESVFAFNPLYLEIDIQDTISSAVSLTAYRAKESSNRYSVDCVLAKGRSKIYYNRILQLLFRDTVKWRSEVMCIELSYGGVMFFSTTHKVLWGKIQIGDKFLGGVFKWLKGKPTLELTKMWFRHYPFTVSLFSDEMSGEWPSIEGTEDGKSISVTTYRRYSGSVQSTTELRAQETLSEVVPADIFYIESLHKFLALSAKNEVSARWTVNKDKNFGSDDEYNDEDEARNDSFWISDSSPETLVRYDSQQEELAEVDYGNVYPEGIFELRPSIDFKNAVQYAEYIQQPSDYQYSAFDFTFDYTFFMSHKYDVRVHLIVSDNKAGYYMRWIDKFGYYQYFLFISGEEQIKNKQSKNQILGETEVRGVAFNAVKRSDSISIEKTYKCGATGMTDDIYEYVSTIVESVVVDMFLGTTEGGMEIWVPVRVSDGSYKIRRRDFLHDIEFGFCIADNESQNL